MPGEKWVKEPPPACACSQSVAAGTAGRAEARDPLCPDSKGGTATAAVRDDTRSGMRQARSASQCHLAPSAPSQKESPCVSK